MLVNFLSWQEYKVRTVLDDWDAHLLECRYGPLNNCLSSSNYSISRNIENRGNLVIFETQEEWACIQHWIIDSYQPASPTKYAISLRADFNEAGIYKWLYPDGTTTFPDFTLWAANHPTDEPCVSMEVGVGADSQGAWKDGACLSELMYAVCERKQI